MIDMMDTLDPVTDGRRWIRKSLNGVPVWILPAVLAGKFDGSLAPDAHITDGDLDWSKCFASESYAHVYADGSIWRHRKQIATVADLVPR